jgi:uncharacterized tellurite resistance protein B-like protein
MKWMCSLIFLSICFFTCDTANGRAGGGGGFSSGGSSSSYSSSSYSSSSYSSSSYSSSSYSSSSGGSGSGGSGGGGGLRKKRDLLFDLMLFLVPVFLIVMCYVVSLAKRKMCYLVGLGKWKLGIAKVSDFGRISFVGSIPIQEMDALLRSDPDFDANAFLQRFRAAFLKIQKSWSAQGLSQIKHFVSDGIFERFTLQIQEQQDMGYRDFIERIQIHSADLVEATSSQVFDIVTVLVRASAVDYRVSLETGKYISGNQLPEGFTECWSFVRRRGVRSDNNKLGLIEGCCPNCGDTIRMNQLEKCESCDALLRSGEYDWVLSEITQGCVWRRRNQQQKELADRYRELQDPGFNIQHVEDRASVIFWRKAMADRLGNTRPLLKVATTELCQEFEAEFKRSRRSERGYFGNCSVGSVDLRGLLEEKDCHYMLVEVHWSGHFFGVSQDGAVQDHGQWKRYKSLLVLMRQQGVKTDIRRAVTSAHCPNCGAPETDVASHACEFCETVLNDGHHDWVLAHYYHFADVFDAQRWLARARSATRVSRSSEFAPPRQPEEPEANYADLMAWSLRVFAEDQVLDDQERQVLEHLAAKQDMRRPMLDGLMECALKGDLEAPKPTDSRTLKLWMEKMVDAALEDGNVEPDERALLVQLGKRAGLKDVNLDLMIDKRRAEWVCRALREPEPKETPDLDPIYRTLLEGLCCVMASDGKATKAEKETIIDLIHKTGAPLPTDEVEDSIADFVSRVKTHGLSSLLDRCVEDMGRHCTKPANQRVFRRALKIIAKADGEVHRMEKQVLSRLLAACELETATS